jgi:hypothetical protein
MRALRILPLCILSCVLSVTACGTNTDSPVFPIYSVVAIGSPAIVNLEPVISTDPDVAPAFKIYYYVTNQEDEFIGYNLYISQAFLSSESIIAGSAGAPYLPDGVDPTFRHSKSEASTASANLKNHIVANFKAAPSPEAFQYCRVYYFALRAVVSNGQFSQPGPQLSSCLTDTNFCPTSNDCN